VLDSPSAEIDSLPGHARPATATLRSEQPDLHVRGVASVPQRIDNLPQLQPKLSSIVDTYLDVQQDILETFVDRGQLRKLGQPTVLPNGKRIPGLKLDHPRQLAVMHALVCFSHIAAESTFTTVALHARTAAALGVSPERYRLSSLRYDLSKLRAKGLLEKLPDSRRYRLLPEGYRICLVFLKLFERIYAPLTAGLLQPFPGDGNLQPQRLSQLDKLYRQVVQALDRLLQGVASRRPKRHAQREQNSRYVPYNGLKLGRTDDPLQLPHGEAADVQVDLVQSGHRAVVRELDLELQLVPCNGQFAHRARGADACTAPCAIRPAGGELPSSDRCSGCFAEEGFVQASG
jgi:hypothetical protein